MKQMITIRRRARHEAEQAIRDLEKRNYVLVGELKELSTGGKRFTRDTYNRFIYSDTTNSSCWFAKMEREINV